MCVYCIVVIYPEWNPVWNVFKSGKFWAFQLQADCSANIKFWTSVLGTAYKISLMLIWRRLWQPVLHVHLIHHLEGNYVRTLRCSLWSLVLMNCPCKINWGLFTAVENNKKTKTTTVHGFRLNVDGSLVQIETLCIEIGLGWIPANLCIMLPMDLGRETAVAW